MIEIKNPARPGRGPRHMRCWYRVTAADGRTFEGRFVDFDTENRAKVDHLLMFEVGDGSTRTVRYGELVSAEPMRESLREVDAAITREQRARRKARRQR